MLIKEYRIVMPLSVSEYQVGQLYSTIKLSKNETGGGEGIEIVEHRLFENEQLQHGQTYSGTYTYKIYHLESKAPTLLKVLMPKNALKLHEESWNAFPYCKTVLRNPGYMKDDFFLIIESLHLEGNNDEENVLEVPEDKLQQRQVIAINIAGSINSSDYNNSYDPTSFRSDKTGRGPLTTDWVNYNQEPLMTCYKLVTIDCKWLGLQNRIEKMIQNIELRLFTVFHRQIFCWIDEWYNMTVEELHEMERQAKQDLEDARQSGEVRGLSSGNAE